MNLTEPALDLAREGWAVFPCNVDKSPRVTGGYYSASTDEETIRGWDWNSEGLLGLAIPEGIIVVDVDPRNGGDETMVALQEAGHLFGPTRLVRTRAGGTHRYYKVPEGVDLRGTLGPGIDIKLPGKGYVIAPPSEGYETRINIEPAWAPDWLLDELSVEPREEREREASEPKWFQSFEHGTAYGLRALENELGRLATAPEGGRNNALNRATFSLAQLCAGGELEEDHARDELMTVAALIGLEDKESAATIDSGFRAGEREPRQAPGDFGTTGSSGGDSIPRSPAEADGEVHWVDWNIDEELPPFYCWPMLPKSAYVLVYGPTEAAKSMTWLGLLSDGSKLGLRSSIYSLENPPALDRDRLRRWAPDSGKLRLTNGQLDLFDRRQLESLVRREIDWHTNVIFIDTYSHAFNSRGDDGNAKAIEFARAVRYIMAEVGCSVVVVNHTGFEGDEPRDASAKRQQVNVAILMRKANDWAAGQPSKFTMFNMKSARFGNPFRLAGAIHDVKDDKRGLELRWPDDAPEWRL